VLRQLRWHSKVSFKRKRAGGGPLWHWLGPYAVTQHPPAIFFMKVYEKVQSTRFSCAKFQGWRLRPKMGTVLAWSQNMVSVTGAFQAWHQVVALMASFPQHLIIIGARHGDRAWWAAAWTILFTAKCPHLIIHCTKLPWKNSYSAESHRAWTTYDPTWIPQNSHKDHTQADLAISSNR